MKNSLSKAEKTNVKNMQDLIISYDYLYTRLAYCMSFTGGVPVSDHKKIIYIIPKISYFVLNHNSVNIEQLGNFYGTYNKLAISSRYEFVVHPLLPAIKSRQTELYLQVLNSKYSLFEIKESIEKILSFMMFKCQNKCHESYKEHVMFYIPTIKQFDQAVKKIKILNKEVVKSAVECLAKFKLPICLTDMIVDFLKLDEVIFSTMDVAVLRALVLKQKVNEQNIEHSVLLDTRGVDCGLKDLLYYKELEKIQQQSIEDAKNQDIIGPREIPDFVLQDVEGLGNCFYLAIADQMKLSHDFTQDVVTDLSDTVRRTVQGTNYLDREWVDDVAFEQFVTIFYDVILAVIDTRNPTAGFICYYIDGRGTVITNTGAISNLNLPTDRTIFRLAATGNHFLSVRAHPSLERGAITQVWSQNIDNDLEMEKDVISNDKNSDLIVKAVFSIQYKNPLLNHAKLTEIFKLIKDIGGSIAITELMSLKKPEAYELSTIETAEEIVDIIIEQNFFLSNAKGREFIQTVAGNFDAKTLEAILELGRDQDIAEQIVSESEAQGTGRVIAALLGKELLVDGATDNLENILAPQELNQLRIVPNGVFNPWSNKAYLKIVEYIDNLAKNLDDLLNIGRSGNQVAVIIALLEEWIEFAASGQKFIGGRPPHYNPDDNDDWSHGSGGSSDGNNNSSAENFDNHNEFVGLILPSYNGTDYNITDYQM